ncbi:response regulator [Achromobacter xylosoxidans]|jgi:two-component system chemotaxis response regulator CheY|uniref:Chemotaxis protein CheY n=6 Tax=Achromobacter TaxID=222 RepID=A0A1D8ICG9_9BURK|nr:MULTISPECIES: response regulator [Achromobacter]ALX83828.1 two-component system response regulator [Achromobacter denitrificans]AKP90940.1 Chemotaxis regulator-transmits chemoreceptor signals to flagelllar motor components CheY [Achromobacter xylosoxidans]AMG35708.1 response regulator [Achromobacter xylosoxidans]AMG47075.1 response regulator [Achromobacter xylosoxidans]AMH06867.1 response regulator [Achromobacter xylosoxidans]
MAATILVADDSATMRMIVQATLTGAGWKVLTAGNGQEALEVAKSHPVDLVVSDWNMPVMGGLQLIQGLREQEQYLDVPVLVLTTEDDVDSKMAARDLGVCGWLSKPVDPDVLVELASELLDEQSGA